MNRSRRRLLLDRRVLIIEYSAGWEALDQRQGIILGWLCDCPDGTWIADLDNGHYLPDDYPSAEAAVVGLLEARPVRRAS